MDFVGYDPQAHRKSTRPRLDTDIERDVVSVFEKLPQGDEDWSDGRPQTDEEVGLLFGQLTLGLHLSPEARRLLNFRELLEEFAAKLDPDCQLHAMTLAAACQVAFKQGVFLARDARSIMRGALGDTNSVLDAKRRATPKFIRILDILHHHRVVDSRTYEIPLRRSKYNSDFLANCY